MKNEQSGVIAKEDIAIEHSIYGDVRSQVNGSIVGDIYGNFHGTVQGGVYGDIYGDFCGVLTCPNCGTSNGRK